MIKRIIIHWTAGGYYPNLTDLQHYHKLIDENGKIYNGKFPISANEVCKNDKNGNALYAAHTGGGNTGSIGVSMCGMRGFSGRVNVGKYPLKKIQCEACFKLCAELCKEYNIIISSQTVMTHYEFGLAHRNTSSCGKIDIIYLPPYSDIEQNKIGDFIRNKILWYYQKV